MTRDSLRDLTSPVNQIVPGVFPGGMAIEFEEWKKVFCCERDVLMNHIRVHKVPFRRVPGGGRMIRPEDMWKSLTQTTLEETPTKPRGRRKTG